jgi:hypothetical protein
MNLKDDLFPDTNITGHTDSKNQPILVGQKLKDESGDVWYVHREDDKYIVATAATLDNPNTQRIPLNLFVTMSQNLEIYNDTQSS